MSALLSDSLSELLTTADLARILRKSVHSIRSDLVRNPRSLPPRCVIPGTNRILWRRQDVEAWLASHVVTPDLIPQLPKQKNKRGAPTKSERFRRQQVSQASVSA